MTAQPSSQAEREDVALLPCPFCGGSNTAYVAGDGCEYTTCDDCLADGPVAATEAEARAAWNTRPDREHATQRSMPEEVVEADLDRVYEAIIRAGCPGREGPYGGYDYGYNEEFYGPAPLEGRYVVRDFRDPNSPTWGHPVHYSHDRDEHEAAYWRLTGRHIALAAIRALIPGASA